MVSFEQHIKGNKPVLVDFYADWCQPCKLMGPVLREVKDKIGDQATILKLNVDNSRYYSQLYNIASIPTLMIFQQGKVLWRVSGVVTAQQILQQLNQVVSA